MGLEKGERIEIILKKIEKYDEVVIVKEKGRKKRRQREKGHPRRMVEAWRGDEKRVYEEVR